VSVCWRGASPAAMLRRMTRSWSRLAGVYDWQLPLERTALRVAADLVRLGPEDRVLDVGTGTAGFLRELARRQPRPRHAIGLDCSAEMLERAAPLPAGWELVQGRAQAVPFLDRSFDVVAAIYLLHLLEPLTRAAVLKEARRLLRAPGRLISVTVAPPRSAAARMLAAPILPLVLRSRGPLAGLRPLDPRDELRRAGFAIRRTVRTSRGYPSLIVLSEGDARPDDQVGQ
jgi:ubiquinone/menaquinone biosynthesis C-methylase UbiE